MKLYYAPRTIASASVITLHEAGLDFEPVLVDVHAGEQHKPEYLAINPKGRVPALATSKGLLTETGAIVEYVATLAPQASLVPDDPWDAAQMRSVMQFLGSTFHVSHAHKLRGSRWARSESSFKDMQGKVAENMSDGCNFLENGPFQGPYVMGNQFTLADPWLFTISCWLKGDGVDIANYPKLAAFQKTMLDRPSVQYALENGFVPRDMLP